MPFDPDQYISSKSSKESNSGFDPDSYIASRSEPVEGGGAIGAIARGAVHVANTVDSYTGAPARAGVGALQDGKGIGGAIGAAAEQFGEDPTLAPTSKDIRKKAGVDLGDDSILKKGGVVAQAIQNSPTGRIAAEVLSRFSPNDLAEFVIDSGADLTNLVPIAGIAKAGIKTGVNTARKGLVAAKKGTKAVEEAVSGAAANVGKRVLSGASTVDVKDIEDYVRNQDRLKDIVDTRSGAVAIKDEMDAALEPLQSKVGEAKERLLSAKERRSEELSRLADQQREGKEALRLSEQQRIGETAARVSGDVQRLNKEVSAGSEKAYSILDQEGIRVPVSPIKGDLTKGIKALEASAVTDEQVAVVDLLKRYRERLDKLGPDVAGGEAKRLIQSLDREMKFLAPGSVSRLSKDDQVLGILRKRFDAPLKESPAYAKQMEGVAKDTRLLIGAEDMATESGAARSLQAAQRPSGKDRADILRTLGARQGQDYLAAVDRSTLPEYQKLKGVLQRYRAARKGPELKSAQVELDSAIEELAPFKSVAPNEFGKSGSEALIRNQIRGKGKNIDSERLVQQIDKKFGTDFARKIEDLGTVAAFDKNATRGSANTNVWTVIFATLGGLVGGIPGGVLGGAGGAMTGRFLVDKYGPATARIILDQLPALTKAVETTGTPSTWINSLNVPQAVKNDLNQQFLSASIAKGARGGTAAIKPIRESGTNLRRVAEEEQESDREPAAKPSTLKEPKRGEALWAEQGAKKLGISSDLEKRLLQSKQGKRLLIEASDLPAGSKGQKRIMEQIQKGWGK